jgi:two-component system, response regulator YesN
MSFLPPEVFRRIYNSYRRETKLSARLMSADGRLPGLRANSLMNRPRLVEARAAGLAESVRWGEPSLFFLLPNVVCWIMPIVRGEEVLGGIEGGAVIVDPDPYELIETVNHLAAAGCPRKRAEEAVRGLPVRDEAACRSAAALLFEQSCRESPWPPDLLIRNRRRSEQQRQIAEEIHRRKRGGAGRGLMEDERVLLSLMKAGDVKGARRELNRAIGALFTHTADLVLIKAHVIEMMGYLVRRALEDSPQFGSLIARNHAWMRAIIDASDYEELASVISDSLDDFLRNIYLHGQTRANATVARLIEIIADRFHDPITLDDLSREVGLSTYRISHLIKEVTGRTFLQHVHQMRVREAQRLLEESDLSCADIAYEAGFGDQSYFIKQFRKRMGITPARYRKLLRARRPAGRRAEI